MRPKVSAVLTQYLKQCNEPPWTSYFIRVFKYHIMLPVRLFSLKYTDVIVINVYAFTTSIEMFTMISGVNRISIGHLIRVQIITYYVPVVIRI